MIIIIPQPEFHAEEIETENI